MEKLPPKQKKLKGVPREDLLKLSKEELVDRLIQLEAHNTQLKNIIAKNLSEASEVQDQSRKSQKKFDFSKYNKRHILLHIAYFGWDYNGYVVQEDTINTIEHHLFQALTRACLIESREQSDYHRCGRTDKGVSAFGQVISISVRSKCTPEEQIKPESISTELSYCKVLNRLLPKEIRAVGWMPVPQDFSARFDCKRRKYKYYFPRSSLNIEAMRSACTMLVGSHDFRNLCKMDVGNGVTEFRRQILKADIVAVDDNDVCKSTSMFYLLIEGNAFLWHQIRCIQAILLLVGSGQESPEVVQQLLDYETNDRKPQYSMAIDVPLNLFMCSYDIEDKTDWVYDEEELEKLIIHFQGQWTINSIKAQEVVGKGKLLYLKDFLNKTSCRFYIYQRKSTMMKDCLQILEQKHSKLQQMHTEDSNSTEKFNKIVAYHYCLTEGVKPKIYTPLMKRRTCSSLEEKKEHFIKRRKQYEANETVKNEDMI